jgi:hypothetical protein
MRELEDRQRKGEVTRYRERATLLEKEPGWWTQVFDRTAQHHSSEVSVGGTQSDTEELKTQPPSGGLSSCGATASERNRPYHRARRRSSEMVKSDSCRRLAAG